MEKRLCPLCLKTKEIADSHFIPKAVYPYCRDPEGNTIVINPDYLGFSDRQIHTPLLCFDCEDILNKGGEAWLMPLLADYDREFPLHEIVTRLAPQITDGDANSYAAVLNPSIDCQKLTHFAMGIFWKAAVHSWRRATTEPVIDLGEYREPIRRFLLGEITFPSDMALTIGILPAPTKLITFELPLRGEQTQWVDFSFYIPGIRFVLAVGTFVTSELKDACFVQNPAHPLLVMNFSGPIYQRIRAELMSPKNVKRFESLGKRIQRPS